MAYLSVAIGVVAVLIDSNWKVSLSALLCHSFGGHRFGAQRSDRRPQGCGRRAYRDVFTAGHGNEYRIHVYH